MPSIPEEIITRSLQHTATEEELEVLNAWLKEDRKNIGYYFQLEELWQSKKQVQTDAFYNGWEALATDISKQPQPENRLVILRKIYLSLRYVAAMFIGALLMASVWLLVPDKNNGREMQVVQHTVYNRTGVQNVLLADNSEVWMNENSRLSYPEAFNGSKRIVTLEGNAYFDIQKDKEKPFIIRFGHAEIEVTGTEFFVETAIGEEAFVTLISGGIDLRYLGTATSQQRVSMLPGQRACLNITTGNIAVSQVETYYYEVWKSGVYSFTNEPLEKITDLLAQRLHMDIRLSPSLKVKRFTGRVTSDEPIETFLATINKVYPIKYKITGKTIEISELY